MQTLTMLLWGRKATPATKRSLCKLLFEADHTVQHATFPCIHSLAPRATLFECPAHLDCHLVLRVSLIICKPDRTTSSLAQVLADLVSRQLWGLRAQAAAPREVHHSWGACVLLLGL